MVDWKSGRRTAGVLPVGGTKREVLTKSGASSGDIAKVSRDRAASASSGTGAAVTREEATKAKRMDLYCILTESLEVLLKH